MKVFTDIIVFKTDSFENAQKIIADCGGVLLESPRLPRQGIYAAGINPGFHEEILKKYLFHPLVSSADFASGFERKEISG